MTRIRNKVMAVSAARLQEEAYELFEVTSAPCDEKVYDEMVEWIVDQLKKSTILPYLSEDVVEITSEEYNAHMAAAAIERVLREEKE